jgi:hypothetical protein
MFQGLNVYKLNCAGLDCAELDSLGQDCAELDCTCTEIINQPAGF